MLSKQSILNSLLVGLVIAGCGNPILDSLDSDALPDTDSDAGAISVTCEGENICCESSVAVHEGQDCDLENLCTQSVCRNGYCIEGSQVDCGADGLCDPSNGECCSGCMLEGRCYLDEEIQEGIPCLICDAASHAFVNNDGAACDAGDPCLFGDLCQGGVCVEGAEEKCPSDQIACNGEETCSQGTCSEPVDLCAFPSACDTTTPPGSCVAECAADQCTINNACYATGAPKPGSTCMECDPTQSITSWTPVHTACSDGIDCTDDTCLASGACSNTISAGSCKFEVGGTSQCVASGAAKPDNMCLECNPAVSQIFWSARTGQDCVDGDQCTYGDQCNTSGLCVGTTVNCTDEAGVCAVNRSCNGTDTCTETFPQPSTNCADDDACTLNDHCDGAGFCVGSPKQCDDSKLCTIDSCDPASGTCGNDVIGGNCLIQNQCYEHGVRNPANLCEEECNSATPFVWTSITVECCTTSDCVTGEMCNTTTNTCECDPGIAGCCADSDCGVNESCDVGGTYTCGCDTAIAGVDCCANADCGVHESCDVGGTYTCGCDTALAGVDCCGDADCGVAGETCNTTAHMCECDPAIADCCADSDCSASESCDLATYSCGCDTALAGVDCCGDADCGVAGETCNTTAHMCECDPAIADCCADSDCSASESCDLATYSCGCDTALAGVDCCGDADCGVVGETCNTTAHMCECDPAIADCCADSDCSASESCDLATYSCGCDTALAGVDCCGDADCGVVGETCNTTAHMCECDPAIADCCADSDCSASESCDLATYSCGCDTALAGVDCCGDADCGVAGETCNTTAHMCECDPAIADCCADSDCSASESCDLATYSCGCDTALAGVDCCGDADCGVVGETCNTTAHMCECDPAIADCCADSDCSASESCDLATYSCGCDTALAGVDCCMNADCSVHESCDLATYSCGCDTALAGVDCCVDADCAGAGATCDTITHMCNLDCGGVACAAGEDCVADTCLTPCATSADCAAPELCIQPEFWDPAFGVGQNFNDPCNTPPQTYCGDPIGCNGANPPTMDISFCNPGGGTGGNLFGVCPTFADLFSNYGYYFSGVTSYTPTAPLCGGVACAAGEDCVADTCLTPCATSADCAAPELCIQPEFWDPAFGVGQNFNDPCNTPPQTYCGDPIGCNGANPPTMDISFCNPGGGTGGNLFGVCPTFADLFSNYGYYFSGVTSYTPTAPLCGGVACAAGEDCVADTCLTPCATSADCAAPELCIQPEFWDPAFGVGQNFNDPCNTPPQTYCGDPIGCNGANPPTMDISFCNPGGGTGGNLFGVCPTFADLFSNYGYYFSGVTSYTPTAPLCGGVACAAGEDCVADTCLTPCATSADCAAPELCIQPEFWDPAFGVGQNFNDPCNTPPQTYCGDPIGCNGANPPTMDISFCNPGGGTGGNLFGVCPTFADLFSNYGYYFSGVTSYTPTAPLCGGVACAAGEDCVADTCLTPCATSADCAAPELCIQPEFWDPAFGVGQNFNDPCNTPPQTYCGDPIGCNGANPPTMDISFCNPGGGTGGNLFGVCPTFADLFSNYGYYFSGVTSYTP